MARACQGITQTGRRLNAPLVDYSGLIRPMKLALPTVNPGSLLLVTYSYESGETELYYGIFLNRVRNGITILFIYSETECELIGINLRSGLE